MTHVRGPKVRAARPVVDRALEVGARAHFEDPAYYAKTYATRTEDVAFYVKLAEHVAAGGGSILEYGIGAGRIAIPMARAGAAVTGVDWSEPMLSDLEARLAREEPDVRARVRAVHGDMREVKLKKRFTFAGVGAEPRILCRRLEIRFIS